ncbi:sensor histidine kinase [Occallatibacter savannae]|uniref:sensor histidine kinase n=1 Tax=Occallatibacter savannae TaxID=1002691 RepID=UPI000D68C064|nr:ATP-binding protein [Occallatibacter savannae]
MSVQDPGGQQSIDELARENEARVQLGLDGAYVGLFEWNLVTGQSQWSLGFYRLHGLEAGEGASFELWRNQVHPDDIARVESEIQKALAEGVSLDTDYRIIRPDGQLRWTYLKAVVTRNAEGAPQLMAGYCGDITRRKMADAALLEAQKLAIAGRVSAAIAHEINNPLEAAFNLLYLSRGLSTDQTQIEMLDKTVDQLRRVSEISQQTLRFARPSQPRRVLVSEVVDSTLHLLGRKLSLAAVDIETDLRPTRELFCSPNELQQILTNILNNAAEASRERRKIRIRVREAIAWCDRNAHGVRITIADGGPGMPPDTLRRLREPFFTTKDEAGTGLGMWVVEELMNKYEGSIAIRSSTDPRHRGTTLSLFLPFDSHRVAHS